ncbi:MAG: hypothetical protein M4579_002082 [Chaenotheca gracillima]|nr:MAG: hypothetical protein M4579_002082 [Chaenotheca gracillima]
MNGHANHGLDEGNFGEKEGLGSGLKTFDAFPKTKIDYTTRHARGGQWTIVLVCTCLILSFSELLRFYRGHESQQFSVEKGVGHVMQINLDMVVAMNCPQLHVNVQDASGDRILAGDMLQKDETSWGQYLDAKGIHRLSNPSARDQQEEHVSDVIGQAGKGKRKFKKTPKLRGPGPACRIFGSMEVNKVQADFHITAVGHGYAHYGEHLEHDAFNFSHIVNELSFGAFYPSLHNPLDATIATTPDHFYKFQYYLSIVPTLYKSATGGRKISTNQYAVTEQSHDVGDRGIPGVFFKFDIEPVLLMVTEERGGFLAFIVRLVNVISGVLVAGGWGYQLWEMIFGEGGLLWRRRARRKSEGVLHGKHERED